MRYTNPRLLYFTLLYFLDSLPFYILNSLLLYYLLFISYKHGLSHHVYFTLLTLPQLNYINVVRPRERHDFADLTSLALYDFSVSKWVLINLVHRCIAQQCMTLK